ncbi:hypothetical protein MRB53_001798 [Persea americana]|uniref:Uncharacterized protein n=1 Tax=Persea americana TaxID=3435 RepID=A0ACC2MSR9_PERAE|nr:hypothetical protein MRB53_001798 [Persea americana]
MSVSLAIQECELLIRAFSGFGVDEQSMISLLTKLHPDQRQSFRKSSPRFFSHDDRLFEKWEHDHIKQLEIEFSRFKKAVVLWTMHPWERDARFAYEIIHKGYPLSILIEIACTRSSEELLGARKAYHSLFNHSIEEDVAYYVKEDSRSLLVALVSSFRYEGPVVNAEIAKSEAKTLGKAIKEADGKLLENEDVIRILSTRSKLQLIATFSHYKEIRGKNIDEDLEDYFILQATVQCIYSPPTYFSQVLDVALNIEVDEITKEALTRVIVTRADVDMKEIKEAYQKIYGVPLTEKIKLETHGNFKDFLLALAAKGGY